MYTESVMVDENKYEVEFEYYPKLSGLREPSGGQLLPEEDEFFEIETVYDSFGNEIELTAELEEKIVEELSKLGNIDDCDYDYDY